MKPTFRFASMALILAVFSSASLADEPTREQQTLQFLGKYRLVGGDGRCKPDLEVARVGSWKGGAYQFDTGERAAVGIAADGEYLVFEISKVGDIEHKAQADYEGFFETHDLQKGVYFEKGYLKSINMYRKVYIGDDGCAGSADYPCGVSTLRTLSAYLPWNGYWHKNLHSLKLVDENTLHYYHYREDQHLGPVGTPEEDKTVTDVEEHNCLYERR